MGISKRYRRKRSTKCVKVKHNKKTCKRTNRKKTNKKKTNRKKTNRKKTNKKRQIGAGGCQGKPCVPGRRTKAEKERREREYRERRAEQNRMDEIIIAEMQRRREEQELAKQRAEQERRATEARERAEQQLARERAAAHDKISAELPTYRKMQQDFNDALNEERIKSEKKGEFAFEKFHQKKDAVVDLWERAISSQRELADKGVFMPFHKLLNEEREKDPDKARQAGPLSRTTSPPLSRTSSPVLSRTSSLESCEAGNCPIMNGGMLRTCMGRKCVADDPPPPYDDADELRREAAAVRERTKTTHGRSALAILKGPNSVIRDRLRENQGRKIAGNLMEEAARLEEQRSPLEIRKPLHSARSRAATAVNRKKELDKVGREQLRLVTEGVKELQEEIKGKQGVEHQAVRIPDLYRDEVLERDQEFKRLKAIMANYEETYGLGQHPKDKDFIAAGLLESFGNTHNRTVKIIKDAGEENISRQFSM